MNTKHDTKLIKCPEIGGQLVEDTELGYKTVPVLVNFVAAVAYHFFLNLPAAFTQPGAHLFAEPCKPLDRRTTSVVFLRFPCRDGG